MASESRSVWAIDLGNNSVKALHLSNEGGVVTVIGFDNIHHSKILNGSGVKESERDELIALSLRQFVKQNNPGKEDVIISVPGQNSFARFVKLPPVEPKRIPEIVKFEAAQQIPFDISDIQWDWQMMSEPGSAEGRVGIFAIKNEVVSVLLEHFSRENIKVVGVQMTPMALYNYALYDRADVSKSDNQATVVIDIGAENTDLVVCTKSTVWQRCIPMGGNAFTKAIADTFKLNFEKAEKLKRTAPVSKYARQVFQAMRPVFTDLASEIQRSLGFYTNSNPNIKLSKVIALGGGTKMRGLLKYLQQTLQLPVERPDSLEKLSIGSSVSAAKFHENVSDFGVVYGLALQGLGLAKVESNLLPRSIARSMVWVSKAKYFTIAACVLLLVSLMCFARTMLDRISYGNNSSVRQKVSSVIDSARQAENKLSEQKSKAAASEAVIQKAFEPLGGRDMIPKVYQTIISALPNVKNNPEQEKLYQAFDSDDIETILQIPRKERKQIFITSASVYYTENVDNAVFVGGKTVQKRRGGSGRGGGLTTEEIADEADAAAIMMSGGGGGAKYVRPTAGADKRGVAAAAAGKKAGFVVMITGYSPYKNMGELMEPVGVGNDPNKWGVITRLLYLDKVIDVNCPFKLYEKTKVEHFRLEIGDVGLDTEMPVGIGIVDVKKEGQAGGEHVLLDAMTNEVISRLPQFDEYGKKKVDRAGNVVYEVNDHWFKVSCKFVWKDVPKQVQVPTATE